MAVQYFQIPPGSKPPDISAYAPYRSVVIVEDEVSPEWQAAISSWLVHSGCLYMMAWGKDCSTWDDSVDFANLEQFDFGDIPDGQNTMTTWHDDEPLQEVFRFAKSWAVHPSVELPHTLLVHISENNRESEFLAEYANA